MSDDPIPTDTIDTLERTWQSVSALLEDASDDEWRRPTDCPGWTVQDQLSHLVGTERMMQGLPTARVELRDDHRRSDIAAFNNAEIALRRARAGAEVLAEWNDVVSLRLATLRAADAAYFDRPAKTPVGPGTVASFLELRILDCWVHEQDIRRALGRPGNAHGPAAEHTIDRLLLLVPITVGKRAATPEGATVTVELTGPVRRTVSYTVRDRRARIDVTPASGPLATVRMDSDTFVILASGRATFDQCADRVALLGDVALARKVAENLNLMI